MTTAQDQTPPALLEQTIAGMVAENDRLYHHDSEMSDAVSAIERAALDAIDASEPVAVPISWFDPEQGKTVIHTALLRDGKASPKGDAGVAAVHAIYLERDLVDGVDLPPEKRETLTRFQAARQESKERADAIRARVYADMGYEAAKVAGARATEAVAAHSEQLNNALIHTMADAIAALQFIRDTNADWDGLGERALAFLREREAA